VLEGYLGDPRSHQDIIARDGWFDTGDLGTVADGRLTIVGRSKDVLIVNGLNVAPTEVERVVEQRDGVLPAHTAAVAIRDPGASTDGLALFLSTERQGAARDALLAEVRNHLSRAFGLLPEVMVAVAPADIPRTSATDVHFPQGRPSYADITPPRGPAELAERIEELERSLWLLATRGTARLTDSGYRRTYGFFDTAARLDQAVAKGVAYIPGGPFFVDGSGRNTMRLTFAKESDERIREGVGRLAEVFG
jgi:hypothetical protein